MIEAVSAKIASDRNKINKLQKEISKAHLYCETKINECIKRNIKEEGLNFCVVPLEDYDFHIIRKYLYENGYKVSLINNNVIKISW